MPSGEPAPAPSRHDRNLESLGGSTRLELGLGGVARVVRRRGLVLHRDLRRSRSSRSTPRAACCRSATRRSRGSRSPTRARTCSTRPAARSTSPRSRRRSSSRSSRRDSARRCRRPSARSSPSVKSVLATGLEASPLIRVDSSATSPEVARARRRRRGHVRRAGPRRRRCASVARRRRPRRSSPPPTRLEPQVNAASADVANRPETDPAARRPDREARLARPGVQGRVHRRGADHRPAR